MSFFLEPGSRGRIIGSRILTVQRVAVAEWGGIVRWPIWRIAVAERSMEPTLRPGDWLLAWRGLRRRRPPAGGGGKATPVRPVKVRNGQLVIARHPHLPDMLIVKRAAWREADGWWLTADNPKAGGVDSFRFGPVAPELVEGRVLVRYWPPRRR